jgi:hypothetical protein
MAGVDELRLKTETVPGNKVYTKDLTLPAVVATGIITNPLRVPQRSQRLCGDAPASGDQPTAEAEKEFHPAFSGLAGLQSLVNLIR